MLVLGVESSCDETSVAIVRDGKEILSNVVLSQIDVHKLFGGVVPEVASRHHVYNVSMVFKEAFVKANVKYEDIDLVAVTEGPGLIGSLLVGVNAAKTFALMYNKPIIGVHHLAGHIYANAIEHEMRFPLIALLVSGGNTELILMKDNFSFEILGETLDDGTTLNQYSEALRKIGVNILDDNGNLKEMDEIIDDIGAKWATLTKAQQMATAETVAGKIGRASCRERV